MGLQLDGVRVRLLHVEDALGSERSWGLSYNVLEDEGGSVPGNGGYLGYFEAMLSSRWKGNRWLLSNGQGDLNIQGISDNGVREGIGHDLYELG